MKIPHLEAKKPRPERKILKPKSDTTKTNVNHQTVYDSKISKTNEEIFQTNEEIFLTFK